MTIKETAGKILLYYYQLQRTVPTEIVRRQVGFIEKPDGSMGLTSDKKWLTNDLQDINPKSVDIFNAFTFLFDKNYIQARPLSNKGTRIYIGIQPTSDGIDIIESVELGEAGHKAFFHAFNTKVSSGATVDSLIKEKLGNLMNS